MRTVRSKMSDPCLLLSLCYPIRNYTAQYPSAMLFARFLPIDWNVSFNFLVCTTFCQQSCIRRLDMSHHMWDSGRLPFGSAGFWVSQAPFPLVGKQREAEPFFSCSLTTADQVCRLEDQSSSMTILSAEDWSCILISAGLGVVWEDATTASQSATVGTCGCSNWRSVPPALQACMLYSQISNGWILDSFAVFALVAYENSRFAVS